MWQTYFLRFRLWSSSLARRLLSWVTKYTNTSWTFSRSPNETKRCIHCLELKKNASKNSPAQRPQPTVSGPNSTLNDVERSRLTWVGHERACRQFWRWGLPTCLVDCHDRRRVCLVVIFQAGLVVVWFLRYERRVA
jgi:hypothetical protein